MQKTIKFSPEKFISEIARISFFWIVLIVLFISLVYPLYNKIWTSESMLLVKIVILCGVLFVTIYCLFVPLYHIFSVIQHYHYDKDTIIIYDEETQTICYKNKGRVNNEFKFSMSEILLIEQHLTNIGPTFYSIELKNGTRIYVTSLLDDIVEILKRFKECWPEKYYGRSLMFGSHIPFT